jgi:glyoxylase-like metal-dependent hydrolase (beta-lactamase superfamily II)
MEVRRDSFEVPSGRVELTTLFAVQPFENNVYVLEDPNTRECLVIDASEAQPIAESTRDKRVKAILVTHGHRDHHAELPKLKQLVPAPVGIGPADVRMLPLAPDFTIQDGQELLFGAHNLRAIATPGHTPGGTCFLIGRLLFSGDTLFPGGPGNTSNQYGDFPTIIESIRARLFTLPDDTLVLPGHGKSTTIGTEKPYLDEWIARGW